MANRCGSHGRQCLCRCHSRLLSRRGRWHSQPFPTSAAASAWRRSCRKLLNRAEFPQGTGRENLRRSVKGPFVAFDSSCSLSLVHIERQSAPCWRKPLSTWLSCCYQRLIMEGFTTGSRMGVLGRSGSFHDLSVGKTFHTGEPNLPFRGSVVDTVGREGRQKFKGDEVVVFGVRDPDCFRPHVARIDGGRRDGCQRRTRYFERNR